MKGQRSSLVDDIFDMSLWIPGHEVDIELALWKARSQFIQSLKRQSMRWYE
ncbi:hypothetical protein GCM10011499_17710 [Pelagibacterium lentulum]|uniref:Uncharacterized protein n=1 Tax=Pelagibacterium lentulum TaxID=2029865 RepID=A0A916RB93_9HYPH|nr:hypothetical protein GCM10011499_17710 [Pelagibacterium lentulum]